MRRLQAAHALVLAIVCVAAIVGVAACRPIEGVERFQGEFAAAKERRRVLALASPT